MSARDLPSHADPERDLVGVKSAKFRESSLRAISLCPNPHGIGGVPIGGSERLGDPPASLAMTAVVDLRLPWSSRQVRPSAWLPRSFSWQKLTPR